ncbi:MAG TPA: helix-turn-helix transcriptional regulator, partial [Spirochaetota bacterium]|nr:helix-turn-helix transcriptional regulator [Spirochaetota bacterium]
KVLCDYELYLFIEKNSDLLLNHGIDDYYRLIFFQEGNGSISVNGRVLPFISPALLCLTEKEKITGADSDKLRACNVIFKPDIINSKLTIDILNTKDNNYTSTERMDLFCLRLFLNKAGKRSVIQLGPNSEVRIKDLLSSMYEILDNPVDDYWPCRARSYFLELLNYSNRLDPLTMDKSVTKDDEINKIIAYLYTNYKEKITINEITEKFCIDRTTLSKRFQKASGQTIIEYLNRLRINIAMYLLRDTTLPINDIVYRVGFNDLSYFNKIFRVQAQLAPSEYRGKYSVFNN